MTDARRSSAIIFNSRAARGGRREDLSDREFTSSAFPRGDYPSGALLKRSRTRPGRSPAQPTKGNDMKSTSKIFGAALLATGLAVGTLSAHAEDAMKKDSMKSDAMKSDAMKSDGMKKDSMSKDSKDAMHSDATKKDEMKSEKK